MLAFPPKDPDDVLDYPVSWAEVMAADSDTIQTVTWTIPDDLTLESQSNSTTVAVAWISGGEAGTRYEIGCRIQTVGGRTYDRTIELVVREA